MAFFGGGDGLALGPFWVKSKKKAIVEDKDPYDDSSESYLLFKPLKIYYVYQLES
jgi:hypothetical protein